MQELTKDERKEIFLDELNTLLKQHLISYEEYLHLHNAYVNYSASLSVEKEAVKKIAANIETTNTQTTNKEPMKEKIKVTLTPEQVRERNITWSLILGVIMLLIGGLFVATTNWAAMNNLMKTGFIVLITAIFFGISWVSARLLKIEKTAFAFLTLGSLFIPIGILSAGYFELFGSWLSLFGEGKYVLGVLATFLCLPLYSFIASKHQSRLFIWLSYLTSSAFIAFFLMALHLTIDLFYLGISVYNALLLGLYHKYKHHDKVELFIKELPSFSQLNLIISTLFMLAFFNSPIFYSLNVLLTAILYMSMVFVYQTKHYHFVFTALVVYGVYQLIENSILQSLDFIFYAFLGFIYLGMQQYMKNEHQLRKIFQYTSGIISFCAFIYISLQGFMLREESSSVVMFIAYALISFNYMYLAYISKQRIFRYLAPIFFLVAGYESWEIVSARLTMEAIEIYMFAFSALMFSLFYLWNKHKFLEPIKYSSLIVSIAVMLLSSLYTFTQWMWSEFTLFGVVLGFSAFLIYYKESNPQLKAISMYANSIIWLVSLWSIYGILGKNDVHFYLQHLSVSFHLAGSGVLLIAISYIWRHFHLDTFARTSFITGIASYTLGILISLIDFQVNKELIVPLILLGGMGVYILFLKKYKLPMIWSFLSVTTLYFYLSLLKTFHISYDSQVFWWYLLLAPVMLFMIYEGMGKKYPEGKVHFFILAHVLVPLLTFITIEAYLTTVHVTAWMFVVPLLIYGYSVTRAQREWAIKLFAYLGFSYIPLFLFIAVDEYHLYPAIREHYVLLVATAVISLIWFISNESWKHRISWYLVPFSLLTLFAFNTMNEAFDYIDLGVSLFFTIFILYLLHRQKWGLVVILPLGLTFALWTHAGINHEVANLFLFYALAVLLVLAGKRFIKQPLPVQLSKNQQVDFYSLFGFIYALMSYTYVDVEDPLWLQLMTPVLFVVFAYIQIGRVDQKMWKNVAKCCAFLAAFYPYYIVLLNVEMNPYMRTEMYLLPWMITLIVISANNWGSYEKLIKEKIHLALLISITGIIVMDGLKSNTIYDAFIVGILSLLSLLVGMHYRVKSYFLVGAGVLLLNVVLQTRPFWGRMPWWTYLLMGGTTLIGFASFYEWQKQKKDAEGNTLLQSKKKELLEKFKKWK